MSRLSKLVTKTLSCWPLQSKDTRSQRPFTDRRNEITETTFYGVIRSGQQQMLLLRSSIGWELNNEIAGDFWWSVIEEAVSGLRLH